MKENNVCSAKKECLIANSVFCCYLTWYLVHFTLTFIYFTSAGKIHALRSNLGDIDMPYIQRLPCIESQCTNVKKKVKNKNKMAANLSIQEEEMLSEKVFLSFNFFDNLFFLHLRSKTSNATSLKLLSLTLMLLLQVIFWTK